MERHFIILSDSYSENKRIALDILEKDENDIEYITDIVLKIKKACKGDAPFSTHSICTDSKDWESVVKVDTYFKGVEIIKNVDEFISKIMKDRVLKKEDVAKYILTKLSCSRFNLEKLCLLCHENYFNKTGEKLFEDYKILNYDSCSEKIKDQKLMKRRKEYELPRECRILFSEKGLKKIQTINETLKEFLEGKYELVRSEKQRKRMDLG